MITTAAFVSYLLSHASSHAKPHFELRSPAFADHAVMPRRYTCDGQNISIPLQWHGKPVGTRAYALVMRDADTKSPFFHWALYNIPASVTALRAGVPLQYRWEQFGLNSWQHARYQGPCPPQGLHHYQIDLYALDAKLDVTRPASGPVLMRQIRKHMLGKAELVGEYLR